MFYCSIPLETRSSKVRNSEQGISNFLADIIRFSTDCDCATMNCGAVRSEVLFERGVLTRKDFRCILPGENVITRVRITGEQIHEVLENSVSKYPTLDGRFLAVSLYIHFFFNTGKLTD